MTSLFVVVESLRNSYGQIVSNLNSWLRSVLSFEDWQLPQKAEVWIVLGVEPEVAERMATMQLRFEGGRVKVAASLEGDDNVVDSVATIFMHVLRLRKYSDSRWVSLGQSCRTLLCWRLWGFLLW